jgi:beta-galactosidase
LKANLEMLEKAFPEKSVVISEYGLCECRPSLPVGDARRIEMMQSHTQAYREASQVAGAIYFSYNDYRTHIGDKLTKAFRQRVHGVVDVFGNRKESWEVLRRESSPIKKLSINAEGGEFNIEILTRSLENDMPAYTLRDYLLVWTSYDEQGLPVEADNVRLAELAPGTKHAEAIGTANPEVRKIKAEVFRPTGYSVLDTEWVR